MNSTMSNLNIKSTWNLIVNLDQSNLFETPWMLYFIEKTKLGMSKWISKVIYFIADKILFVWRLLCSQVLIPISDSFNSQLIVVNEFKRTFSSEPIHPLVLLIKESWSASFLLFLFKLKHSFVSSYSRWWLQVL